jgi:hypothetical protein
MGENAEEAAVVAALPVPARSNPVSDELCKLRKALLAACPAEAVITFEFDGLLRVHIDARRVEDITQIETFLPALCGGIFTDAQRRLSANHSFFHRLTASVAR